MKVLLIEDDRSIFELITERFAQWNIQVIGPDNFQQVMGVFTEEEPQLVLIDNQLRTRLAYSACLRSRFSEMFVNAANNIILQMLKNYDIV